MRASVVISAFVAVLVGFGGSVAVILAAADAVGTTPAQTSSWVAALCVSMMVTTAILSVRHRIPIVTAWSTPGAALIAASTVPSFEAAVGAFLLAAILILLTAAFRRIGALLEKIPTSIASAMLAGVLFGFVLGIFEPIQTEPVLVLSMVIAFALLRLYSPSWAILVVLVLGVVLAIALGKNYADWRARDLAICLGKAGLRSGYFDWTRYSPLSGDHGLTESSRVCSSKGRGLFGSVAFRFDGNRDRLAANRECGCPYVQSGRDYRLHLHRTGCSSR